MYSVKRTNIVLDETLVAEAQRLTGIKTQRELVHQALSQLVRREQQRDILKLRGAITWEGDLSELRRERTP